MPHQRDPITPTIADLAIEGLRTSLNNGGRGMSSKEKRALQLIERGFPSRRKEIEGLRDYAQRAGRGRGTATRKAKAAKK